MVAPQFPNNSYQQGAVRAEAPLGTKVVAAQSGTVAFAGSVAGGLFVSIDHPDSGRT